MASPSTNFKYTSLDEAHPDAFRLMTLIPGGNDELVQCRLTAHRRCIAKPPYRALSYTWGDEPPSQPIKVNELLFLVTPNLHSALKIFRQDPAAVIESQVLWIDFICINQADILERNTQVSQMQEIFAGAEEVLIWLGPSVPLTATGFVFVEEFCTRLEDFGIRTGERVNLSKYNWVDVEDGVQEFLGEEFWGKWKAVEDALMRSWWKRSWIIQELASARSATVHCGEAHVRWTSLAIVIAILYLWPPKLFVEGTVTDLVRQRPDVVRRAWKLVELRHFFRNRGSIDLYTVLRSSRWYSCRDLRDKFYSVLGLLETFTQYGSVLKTHRGTLKSERRNQFL